MATYSGAPFQSGRVNALTWQVKKISREALNAGGYTHVNYATGVINTTLAEIASANNSRVPTGLLAGSVVVLRGADTVGKHTTPTITGTDLTAPVLTEVPVGILAMDVAGDNFGGYFTSASAPPTYYAFGGADQVAVSIYETQQREARGQADVGAHNSGGSAFTYAAGEILFVDMISGLLTLQAPLDTSNRTHNKVSAAQATKGAGTITPSVDFAPATVANGIWPWPVATVVGTNWEGSSALVIRLEA